VWPSYAKGRIRGRFGKDDQVGLRRALRATKVTDRKVTKEGAKGAQERWHSSGVERLKG